MHAHARLVQRAVLLSSCACAEHARPRAAVQRSRSHPRFHTSPVVARPRLAAATMSDAEIFYDCIFCHGDMERERRSDGAQVCAHNSCKRALKQRNKEAKRGDDAQNEPQMVLPPGCYELEEVIGISRCSLHSMSAREKRCGRKFVDNDIIVQVRGGFGEDENDTFVPGTKWVKLAELAETLDPKEFQVVARTLGGLPGDLQKAAKRLKAAASD